jgi:hypothetical protein
LPLGICDEVQKDFVVVCKKCFIKHGGQTIKQVLKPKRILEHLDSPKPITWALSMLELLFGIF